MSLTNEEAKRLFVWAEKQQNAELTDRVLSKKDIFEESYFKKRDNKDLSYDYGFETLPEIKKQFKELWAGEEYMAEAVLISAVSAMKHKPIKKSMPEENAVSSILDGEFEIPEYVYVF